MLMRTLIPGLVVIGLGMIPMVLAEPWPATELSPEVRAELALGALRRGLDEEIRLSLRSAGARLTDPERRAAVRGLADALWSWGGTWQAFRGDEEAFSRWFREQVAGNANGPFDPDFARQVLEEAVRGFRMGAEGRVNLFLASLPPEWEGLEDLARSGLASGSGPAAAGAVLDPAARSLRAELRSSALSSTAFFVIDTALIRSFMIGFVSDWMLGWGRDVTGLNATRQRLTEAYDRWVESLLNGGNGVPGLRRTLEGERDRILAACQAACQRARAPRPAGDVRSAGDGPYGWGER